MGGEREREKENLYQCFPHQTAATAEAYDQTQVRRPLFFLGLHMSGRSSSMGASSATFSGMLAGSQAGMMWNICNLKRHPHGM